MGLDGLNWKAFCGILWNKTGIGWVLNKLYLTKAVYAFKERIFGMKFNKLSSTVAHSPHVRRFTLRSITQLMEKHGYRVDTKRGSVIFAGSFSGLIFGGVKPIQNLNMWLGKHLPSISSGFYLCTSKQP